MSLPLFNNLIIIYFTSQRAEPTTKLTINHNFEFYNFILLLLVFFKPNDFMKDLAYKHI